MEEIKIRLNPNKVYLSQTVIDLTRDRVKEYMQQHYSDDETRRGMEAFEYCTLVFSAYVLRLLVNKKPYQIARRIHANIDRPQFEIKNALYRLCEIDPAEIA